MYFDEIHLTKYGNQLLAGQVLAGLPEVSAFARATAGCLPEDAANRRWRNFDIFDLALNHAQ